MKDNEKVTICIATHNNASTITRALKSVVGGIRGADKVIIGDNDSTDGTYEVLCKLLGAEEVTIDGHTGLPSNFDGEFLNTKVKIFRKRLSTTGHTLNVAMQMDWQSVTIFGFLDPESWYDGDKIAQAIRIFESKPQIACVVSDWDNHCDNDVVERVFNNSFDCNRLFLKFEYDRNFFVRPGTFGKLKAGFNEKMPIRDDYDLLMRISEVGLIYHIPAPLHNNTFVKNTDNQKTIEEAEKFVRQSAIERRNKSNA